MFRQKAIPVAIAALFITTAVSPILSAATETRFDGDVIINGAFQDATPVGHRQKIYVPVEGDPADPETWGMSDQFVAYDWTTHEFHDDTFTVVPGGLQYTAGSSGPDTAFIQQHFNGYSGPDRVMPFYGFAVTGKTLEAGKTGNLRVELRGDFDADPEIDSVWKRVTLTDASTRSAFTSTDLGLGPAGTAYPLRSLRIWFETSNEVLLERASLYAENGLEGRNVNVQVGGDDALLTNAQAAVQHPGSDGVFTYVVSYADDAGNVLPAEDSVLCLYDLPGFAADDRWFSTNGGGCASAVLDNGDLLPYRSALADGSFRYDIPQTVLLGSAGNARGPLAVWGGVEVDGTSGGAIAGPEAWSTGYLNVARNAADAANVNVSNEYYGPTPIFLEGEAPTPTVVIRLAGGDDEVTPIGGAVQIDAGADGLVTFEYAFVNPDGSIGGAAPSDHGFAVYDAPGFASAEMQPGRDGFTHALASGAGLRQTDGWFRATLDPAAIETAKGPVTIYAYVSDAATGKSLPTLYGLAKENVYTLSTSVAEALSFPAGTPIVIEDSATGLSQAFEATLAAQPTGLFSFTNPLVNPGFEVDGLVEGSSDRAAARTAYGGTMTTPPWFLRLDDSGTGQATDPRSTARVAPTKGTLGSRGLEVKYDAADNGKTLMLGQLFGTEAGQAALVWKDASAVSLFAKSAAAPVTLRASIHYWPDGIQTATPAQAASSSVTVPAGGPLSLVTFSFPSPIEGKLAGFYLVVSGAASSILTLDNVVIDGSHTVQGDARTDLTDGHAMIIRPVGLAETAPGTDLTQGFVEGANGQKFFLYEFYVVDYTSGVPTRVPVAGRTGAAFAFHDGFGRAFTGTVLGYASTNPDAATTLVAAVPVAAVPGDAAAPWAWLGTGDTYRTFGFDVEGYEGNSVASGYFNPVKNNLEGTSIADHLDYAATPVTFDADLDTGIVHSATQDIAVVPVNDGTYRVVVTAAGATFEEATTLTVRKAGSVVSTHAVPVKATGTTVSDLVLTAADLPETELVTADTAFTLGKTFSPGSLSAFFSACIVRETCVSLLEAPLSAETIRVDGSSTVNPTGSTVRYTWHWGDGQVTPGSTNPVATHAYQLPGTYTLTLVATTNNGLSDEATMSVQVYNRAPVAGSILLTNANPTMGDVVKATATASDPEGTTLTYAWRLNGILLDDLVGSKKSFEITSAILAYATEASYFVRGEEYTLSVDVTDAHGATVTTTRTFTAVDSALALSGVTTFVEEQPTAAYALVGETVVVQATAVDADDALTVTATFVDGANSFTAALAPVAGNPGRYEGSIATLPAAIYQVTVTAENANEEVSLVAPMLTVRENTAPVAVLTGVTFMEAHETAVFTATAADVDAPRGLTLAWYLDDELLAGVTGTTYTFDAGALVGNHTLKVVATDASGAVGEATHVFGVDDLIEVALTLDGMGVNERATVTAIVTDAAGAPVKDAEVTLQAFNQAGIVYATTTLLTDEEGRVVWRVPGSFAGGLNLPGTYRVTAEAVAASVPAAPDQAPETDAAQAESDVLVGSDLP